MEPPVSSPDQPLGENGCQFDGWTKCAPNAIKIRIAAIFSRTITLFVSADSRMPRTSTTVNIMTMRNAGQLKPKCHPGHKACFRENPADRLEDRRAKSIVPMGECRASPSGPQYGRQNLHTLPCWRRRIPESGPSR